MRAFTAGLVVSLLANVTYGLQSIQVDVLDDLAEGTLPPAGIVVVDVLVDVPSTDTWTAGGIRGLAVNGARLRYAADPNSGGAALVNPGTSDRFVTFLSEPRVRDGNNRFNNGGAAVAGCYCPVAPLATATPTEVNVAFYANPPETAGSPSVDGAVMRIALDLDSPGPFTIRRLDEVLPGDQVFFIADCDGVQSGCVAATFDQPLLTGFDWALVRPVPEPLSASLFLASVAWLLRSRR